MPGKKLKENHAGARLVERYGASAATLSLEELRQRLHAGQAYFIYRQTATRSLCRVENAGAYIYFIANRKRGTIITVLTEEQAVKLLAEIGRELPGHRPGAESIERNVYVVQWQRAAEVLHVFTDLDAAKAFCAQRVGQALTWTGDDSHGNVWRAAWQSPEVSYSIVEVPLTGTVEK